MNLHHQLGGHNIIRIHKLIYDTQNPMQIGFNLSKAMTSKILFSLTLDIEDEKLINFLLNSLEISLTCFRNHSLF